MMDNTLYAPPATALVIKPLKLSPPFFTVSQQKFTWLYFLTFGLYQYVWYFKNWSNYKHQCKVGDYDDKNIWPLPRAFFAIFFVHKLLYVVEDYAKKYNRSSNFPVDAVATPIVLIMIVTSVCDRLATKGIGSPYTDVIGMLGLFVLFFLTNSARKFINFACDDKEGKGNAQFTVVNYVWMVLGASLWILFIAAIFLPEAAGE